MKPGGGRMIQKELQQTPDITQAGWADEIMSTYAQFSFLCVWHTVAELLLLLSPFFTVANARGVAYIHIPAITAEALP